MFRVIIFVLSMSLLKKVQGEESLQFLFERKPGFTVFAPPDKHARHRKNFASNDLKCALRCTKEEWCNSANFELVSKNPASGVHLCELLSTDEEENVKYLVKNEKFVHLSIKMLNHPCQKQPCLNEGTCIKVGNRGGLECRCIKGFLGKFCQEASANCTELLSAGYTKDGVYQIDPDGQGSFPVYCDMTTDGGGWTVFQRNAKNTSVSFNNSWQEYKTGFGNLTDKFWLGLDKIYRLTKQSASLRVDLEDLNGNTRYAVYSSFSIADESDFYRLTVSGYSGTAGDSLTTADNQYWINNNMRFSTPDNDKDRWPDGSCAVQRKAGWWYDWCTNSDLNGDVTWWTFSKTLKNTQMKLK